MFIISWNVNGLRAIVKKNFKEFLHEYIPEVLCIQETKAQHDNLTDDHTFFDGYEVFLNCAEKKGYSGVATYTRTKPLKVIHGLGVKELDTEGRVLTLEFENVYVINVYVPNAQPGLARIDYREKFNDTLLKFAKKLEKKKPVIICGDLNVAHQEIDLTHPGPNRGNPGFSDEERAKFEDIMKAKFIDTFRFLHPTEVKYSWWSYRMAARSRNIGWRIDYVLTSKALENKIKTAEIHNEVMGSDHCPVSIKLKK